MCNSEFVQNMQKRNSCIIMFIEMRLVWLWVMLLVLASECCGCLEHERIALLQLKASSISQQNGYFLPTWVEAWDGETTTDCCKWERVKCNATTGRVIQLSLNSAENYWKLRDSYLNASMFLPFEKLESLDLSFNQLAGWLENEGFEKLGELTSLKSLNLTVNNLKGTIYINDLKGLNNLEQLDISDNQFDGFITHSGFERLSVLGKLELLRLDWNSFNNSILPSLGVISSLKTLSLHGNYLNGSINIGEFCKMNNLKELDLSDNSIEDIKGFERLSVLGKLELLRLDFNLFNNSIVPSLGVLSSLKTLSLYENHLNGSIDIGELHNMRNLEELDLSYNGVDNIKGLKSLSKLKILDLKYNNFHASILRSLDAPLSLKTLNLRWIELKGLVTSNGLDGLKHIQDLYLDYSSIDKSFLYNVGVMSSLRVLTLRGIRFNGSLPNQGEIPIEVGKLSNIHALNLSHNNLTGSIPTTFSHLRQIESLDLSYNNLNGRIPQLIELSNLEVFSVAYNNLSGPTPERKAQFATFEESSYEGNSLLCGLPLKTNCLGTVPTLTTPKVLDGEVDYDGFIDMEVFYVSFLVSYIIVLMGIVAVLFINPHWRRAWFHLIEVCMTTWYYFVLDNFMKFLSNRSV